MDHWAYGVFTPEQDNDKTTTRQMLNLCIPMMPFTLSMMPLSCRLVVVLLWCENTINVERFLRTIVWAARHLWNHWACGGIDGFWQGRGTQRLGLVFSWMWLNMNNILNINFILQIPLFYFKLSNDGRFDKINWSVLAHFGFYSF